jgi:guanylate kinase
VILEIDFQGAAQIRDRYPDVVSVFVLPPSRAALKNRLTNRGEDEDTAIRQRLAKARWEMSHYRDYDYLIVNDHFDTAVADLECVVRSERLRLARQDARLQGLLADLLQEDDEGP